MTINFELSDLGEEETSTMFYHETKNKQDFKNDVKDILNSKKLNLQNFKENIRTDDLYYFLVPLLKEYGWIPLEVQHIIITSDQIEYSIDNGILDKTTIYAGNFKGMADPVVLESIAEFNFNKTLEIAANEISEFKGTNFYNTFEYVVFKIKNYPPNYNELQEMWNSTSKEFKFKVLELMDDITEDEIKRNIRLLS